MLSKVCGKTGPRAGARSSGFVVAAMACASLAGAARAQCTLGWDDSFGDPGVEFAAVQAMATYDPDGAGPGRQRLYVGGVFDAAGGVSARNIASWDGATWAPLGAGVNEQVSAMAVYDRDGAGAAPALLYAAGEFNNQGGLIASWNGSAWAPLGGGLYGGSHPEVYAMTVFDPDGAGAQPAQLIVGGVFQEADGVPVANIAKWNGTSWSALGDGVDGQVSALAVFDEDGAGPNPARLFAGGHFQDAGGQGIRYLARWDGSTWSSVSGFQMNGAVLALAAGDADGAGPGGAALYVGGDFTLAGGQTCRGVARWSGTAFSAMGNGLGFNGPGADSMAFFNDGTGSALYVGGHFFANAPISGPGNYIAKWNGAAWTTLSSGLNLNALAMTTYHDGVSEALYVGGAFDRAGGFYSKNLARWGVFDVPLMITQSPASAARCVGTSVTFNVAASGSVTGYQWRRNTLPIGGATGPSLTIGTVGTEHQGTYDCVVSGPCGSATSGGAVLTVNAPVVVVNGPSSATVCPGDPVTFSVSVSGTATGFQWSVNGNPIGGATGPSHTIPSATALNQGTYTCAISGPCGGATTLGATLTVRQGPAITDNPDPVTVIINQDAQFSVAASGTELLAYQWLLDGVELTEGGHFFNVNTPVLTVAAVQYTHRGIYSARVSNLCGVVESAGARLGAECPGDDDEDGDVDFDDLNRVLGNFGNTGAPGIAGDENEDGVVDFIDLNRVLGNFGNICGLPE